MTSAIEVWQAMKAGGGVWEHSGDTRTPHVVLRGGDHSDGYIDTLQFLSNTKNLVFAAEAMAKKMLERLHGQPVDWIFGSPMAGIPFATVTGIKMGVPRVGFTEKIGDKEQVCRFDLPPRSVFLDIEEMTTSGETPQRVIDAVIKKNQDAESVQFIGALLNRGVARPDTLHGKEIVHLVTLEEVGVDYHRWAPASCPLCAADSRVLTNPKKVWADFLRTMQNPAHEIPGAVYEES